MYNARCNEFLLTVNKLSCIKKNKAVDTDMGLRDKLKVYAVEKNHFYVKSITFFVVGLIASCIDQLSDSCLSLW